MHLSTTHRLMRTDGKGNKNCLTAYFQQMPRRRPIPSRMRKIRSYKKGTGGKCERLGQRERFRAKVGLERMRHNRSPLPPGTKLNYSPYFEDMLTLAPDGKSTKIEALLSETFDFPHHKTTYDL